MSQFYKVWPEVRLPILMGQFWSPGKFPYLIEHEVIEDMPIPIRFTLRSAGYDIYSPYEFTIKPGEWLYMPTFLSCQIDPGHFLTVVPRSSHGLMGLEILNKFPVIDEDYFENPTNDGHIVIGFKNTHPIHEFRFAQYDRVAQALFLPYATQNPDNVAESARSGGYGSTGL